jgi:hypothetical protein
MIMNPDLQLIFEKGTRWGHVRCAAVPHVGCLPLAQQQQPLNRVHPCL